MANRAPRPMINPYPVPSLTRDISPAAMIADVLVACQRVDLTMLLGKPIPLVHRHNCTWQRALILNPGRRLEFPMHLDTADLVHGIIEIVSMGAGIQPGKHFVLTASRRSLFHEALSNGMVLPTSQNSGCERASCSPVVDPSLTWFARLRDAGYQAREATSLFPSCLYLNKPWLGPTLVSNVLVSSIV